VVSYNPTTGEFRDYGHLYEQNWRQYPRDIAVDDQGWVYFGVGSTASQIIILNPETGEATPVLSEEQRIQGYSARSDALR
jgi:streptogramin lyase